MTVFFETDGSTSDPYLCQNKSQNKRLLFRIGPKCFVWDFILKNAPGVEG